MITLVLDLHGPQLVPFTTQRVDQFTLKTRMGPSCIAKFVS